MRVHRYHNYSRLCWLIGVGVCMPLMAWANPVTLEPSSLLAFMFVAFWALVVEAGIVALLLTLRGVEPLKMFFAYWLANVLVFLFIFEPVLNSQSASVPVLEVMVVLLDALSIKILSGMYSLQGDNFRGVTCLRALCISTAGNAASYFVGVIASHTPWEVK